MASGSRDEESVFVAVDPQVAQDLDSQININPKVLVQEPQLQSSATKPIEKLEKR